ncbi:MAG: hypothetical protein V1704_02725 [Candidatus Vogelbacteria bacterium]
MTLNVGVTDDELGQYFRRTIAIADRLGKSLPFDQVMGALQRIHDGRFERDQTPVTKPASRSILRCLKSGLAIPATNGARLLSEANDVFPGWIDPDLTNYGCNVGGGPKPETLVDVHELIKDCTFCQMFEGQDVDLDKLCLTQDQIIWFVTNYREHLHSKGYATFFLFKVAEQFFVAVVSWVGARRLRVCVDRLAVGGVWCAGYRHRVVLPPLLISPVNHLVGEFLFADLSSTRQVAGQFLRVVSIKQNIFRSVLTCLPTLVG